MLISQLLQVPWLRLRRKMKDIKLGSDQNVHRSRPSLEFSTDMQCLTPKSKIKKSVVRILVSYQGQPVTNSSLP